MLKSINFKINVTEDRKSVIKQVKILQVLKHPNIIIFREAYMTKKGEFCIVNEYGGDDSIAKKIKQL